MTREEAQCAMNQKQALARARKLWGETAFVERRARYRIVGSSKPWCIGVGRNYHEAFIDADRNG